VLNDGDQIEPDQEVRRASTWSVTQTVDFLLVEFDRSHPHPVLRFMSFLYLGLALGIGGYSPRVREGRPGSSVVPRFREDRPDVDNKAMLGFWLTQDTQGTFIQMVDVDISLVFPVGRPFYRTSIVDAMSFGVKAYTPHQHPTRTDGNTVLIHLPGSASRCG
jgi:hypothetical protein